MSESGIVFELYRVLIIEQRKEEINVLNLDRKTLKKIFLVVAACILVYWILHEVNQVRTVFRVIKNIFSPFFVGAALAFVINVPMRAIERWLKGIKKDGLRRVISIILSVLLVLIILSAVCWLLIPALIDTLQSIVPALTNAVTKLEAMISQFLDQNPDVMQWVTNNIDLEKLDLSGLLQKAISLLSSSISSVIAGAFQAIGGIADVVIDLVISVVFSIYCLFQKETLARQGRKLLYAFLPEKFSDETVRILRLSNTTFSNFLSGQCIEACILGSLFAVAMAIFDMPYIPLISVMIAVSAFIPVVGAISACIIGAFLILLNDPTKAFWFVIMSFVLQQFENNVIYPRVVGTSIGLSGMWVLLAVGIGGELMGAGGMFIMIPVASVIYTLLQERTHKHLADKQIDPEKLKAQPPERRPWVKNSGKNKEKRAAEKEQGQQPEGNEKL